VKKLSPFQYLNEINLGKKDIMQDDIAEDQYVPFVVNRTLSYFQDTVLIANEMNKHHHLDNRLQFDFLKGIVRKRKRFSKWAKPDTDADIATIKEYYGYSVVDATQALSVLSADQLAELRLKLHKGGRKAPRNPTV
jgi:hypothetical protein